jgi:gliding motility-associated-like protein
MKFYVLVILSFCCLNKVKANTPPPTNDEPCNALTLPVNNSCSFISYTTIGATGSAVPNPGCAGYQGGDVWFQVTVPASGVVNIETDNIDFSDGGMAIYSGTCSALTLISCDDDNGSGHMPLINSSGLTPGSTIWIRVWENGNNDMGLFNICVTTILRPTNDDPCNAIFLTADTSCNTIIGDNTNASASPNVPIPGCANYLGGDIWYKTVVPANGYLNFNTLPGAITNGGMALYTGSCGNLSLFACDDDAGVGGMPEMSFVNLNPGDTIWIRFWDRSNNDFGTFSICVNSQTIATPPPCSSNAPAGNTCATATPICNLDGYCGNTSSTYTADYWPELGDGTNMNGGAFGTCLGGATIQNNSFLKFVAGSTSATFNVWVTSTTEGVGIQMMFFEANNCSGPVICHGGYDNLFPGPPHLVTASNLVVGNTYYLMIDGVGGDVCNYVIGALTGLSALAVTPSSTSICYGENVSLTASGVAGSGTTYTWNWLDVNGSPMSYVGASLSDTPRVNTTYTVTASGIGVCPQIKNITINVNPKPTAVLITNNQSICNGSNAVFLVQGTNGSTLNYNINNGANNSIILTGGIDTIKIINPSISQTINVTSVNLNNCSTQYNATSATIDIISSTASVTSNNSPICSGTAATFTITGTANATISYNINGGSTVSTTLNSNTSTITIPNATSNQTLNLVSVSNQGCTQNLSVLSTVIINNLIIPTFNQWGPYCEDDVVSLPIMPTSSIEGINGTWNPSSISTSTPGNIQYTFTPSANQGCVSPYSMFIVVHPKPINISAGPDTTIGTGISVQLQGVGQGNSYLWTPSVGLSNPNILNPYANPSITTTYILTVENANGCSSIDSVTVFVNDDCIEPMKIFTPNGDGFYERWIVYTASCVKIVEASVYNRYGSLVYYSKDYKNDWDGTYKGKALPDATYYFVLNIIDQRNRQYTRKGNVTIMR